jgi:hypothetical protein
LSGEGAFPLGPEFSSHTTYMVLHIHENDIAMLVQLASPGVLGNPVDFTLFQ